MGKIRLKTLGEKDDEKQQAVDAQKRRDAKKQKKGQGKAEEVVVTPVVASTAAVSNDEADRVEEQVQVEDKKAEKKSKKSLEKAEAKAKGPGKKHLAAQKKVDVIKSYDLKEAVKLVQGMAYTKFDETLEVHINLRSDNVKGEVTLPHGTGKKVNVAIVDDKVLAEIEAGTINFDILITSPAFMPKLVKFARVLGPKGLMPNPKNGTVSDKPEEAAKKFQLGNVNYKSEAKAPLIHQAVGKVSFKDTQLVENIEALIKAVGTKNISDVYISATMTPSVKLSASSF